MSGFPTSQELTRNRRVGQRECGPRESFSLVSPYRSVSKPRGDSPLIRGNGIPYLGGRNSEPALLFRGRLACMTQRNGCLYSGSSCY